MTLFLSFMTLKMQTVAHKKRGVTQNLHNQLQKP
jgi:hypothetical protein